MPEALALWAGPYSFMEVGFEAYSSSSGLINKSFTPAAQNAFQKEPFDFSLDFPLSDPPEKVKGQAFTRSIETGLGFI